MFLALFYASACFAERLKVTFHQFHNQALIARATPAIALDAANQQLAVVVDLDERRMALGAVFQIGLHYALKMADKMGWM